MSPQLLAQEEDDYLIGNQISIGTTATTTDVQSDEWPNLLQKAHSMIVAPSFSRSSPWVQANETAPMITHCHLQVLTQPQSMRRVRSRSFNDRFDEEKAENARTFHPSYSDLQQQQQSKLTVDSTQKKGEGNPIYLSILYGLINTCVVL